MKDSYYIFVRTVLNNIQLYVTLVSINYCMPLIQTVHANKKLNSNFTNKLLSVFLYKITLFIVFINVTLVVLVFILWKILNVIYPTYHIHIVVLDVLVCFLLIEGWSNICRLIVRNLNALLVRRRFLTNKL